MSAQAAVLLRLLTVLTIGGLVACGPGGNFVLTAENRTDEILVIQVTESDPPIRFYLLEPGARVVVDTVAHANFWANEVAVLNQACTARETVSADFSKGGSIVIAESVEFTPEQPMTFDLVRLSWPYEDEHAHESCADALGGTP